MRKTARPAFPMSNMDELTMLFVLAEDIHGLTLPISVYHSAVGCLQDEITTEEENEEARRFEVLQSLWRSENTLTPYFGGFDRIVASQAAAGIFLFRLSGCAPECFTIDPEWVYFYQSCYRKDPVFPERKRVLLPLARRLAAIIQELAQKGDQQ